MELDTILPRWDFREHHRRRVPAPTPAVMRALETATWGDFPAMRALMAVRTLGRLREPATQPVFTDFLHTGPPLVRTADEWVIGFIAPAPGRTAAPKMISVGASEFASFADVDCVKIACNFRHAGGVLTTETRVAASSPGLRRLFGVYFYAIRPFSGLIRHEWLWGIARRAGRRS